MFASKRIGRFFFGLVVFYVLLIVPWPGLKSAYAAIFMGGANFLYVSIGPDIPARFQPLSEPTGHVDVEITLQSRRMSAPRSASFNSRRFAYLPTAQVIALVLATPIPWRRRWKALVWGLLLVNAFLALRVGIALLYVLTAEPSIWFNLTPFWSQVLYHVNKVLVRAHMTSYVVPFFFWVLATFRRSDWAHILRETGSQASRSGRRESSPPSRSRRT